MEHTSSSFEEIMKGVERDSVIAHLYGQIEERAGADEVTDDSM